MPYIISEVKHEQWKRLARICADLIRVFAAPA